MTAAPFFLTQINAVAAVIMICDEDDVAVIVRGASSAFAFIGPLTAIWVAGWNARLIGVEGFEE